MPTETETQLAAALFMMARFLPDPSLYGVEPWGIIWNAVEVAGEVLDAAKVPA